MAAAEERKEKPVPADAAAGGLRPARELAVPKVAIGRLLRRAFWDCYDHLGTTIGANLFATFSFLPLLLVPRLPFYAALIPFCMAFPPGLAGLYWVAGKLARDEETSAREVAEGVRRTVGRFYLFFVFMFMALGLAGFNVIFYAEGVRKSQPLAGWALTGLTLLLALLVLLMAFTLPAFLALPFASAADRGFRVNLKRSAFSALGFPLTHLKLLLAVLALSVFFGALIFLCFFTYLAVVAHHLALVLLGREPDEARYRKRSTWELVEWIIPRRWRPERAPPQPKGK